MRAAAVLLVLALLIAMTGVILYVYGHAKTDCPPGMMPDLCEIDKQRYHGYVVLGAIAGLGGLALFFFILGAMKGRR